MEDLSKLTRKEREKLYRRQEILDAATKLFSQKGFNNTTLEDIAVKAEFGIGTIYNYFQSKEEIFRSILDSVFNSNLEMLENLDKSTDSVVELMKKYTTGIFEYFYNNQEALLLMVSYFTSIAERPVNLKCENYEAIHLRSNEIFTGKIAESIKKGEIRELNPELLSTVYHSLIFPFITNLIKRKALGKPEAGSVNIDEQCSFILDVLFNGILIKS